MNHIRAKAAIVNPGIPEERLCVLSGLQWSDYLDPNSSITSNRGFVWVKTVTFISDSFGKMISMPLMLSVWVIKILTMILSNKDGSK